MIVTEAIRSRRTIFRFKPDPISDDNLEEILSYGIWAPNHHLTEPWRFIVLGQNTKETLAQRYRQIQVDKAILKNNELTEEQKQLIADAGYRKLMSKPTIVAISSLQEGEPQRQREDYAAVCCAIQNIQLAAWSIGVGIQWSTGPITLEPNTYQVLGMDSNNEYMVGFLYMGYPQVKPEPKRKQFDCFLRYTP